MFDIENLDPKVLAKISSLELRARLIVEGFYSGMHRSPRRGVSVEFADHRVYTQGDDLRHVDWKLFGRTDKYYIKEYEQESNLELMLVLDGSESMGYRSAPDGLTKYAYAAALAAAIAYLALQQHDSVGLAVFDEQVRQFIRASNRTQQWRTLVQALSGAPAPAKTSIEGVLVELAERLPHRTLIILLSDLFDDEQGVLRGLRLLRYHRHELIVWSLWDRAELTFAFTGPTMFDGLEGTGRLLTEPRSLRTSYLEEVEGFQSRMRQGCGQLHIDYTIFNTFSSLGPALSTYLATRSARLRRRSSRAHGQS